MAAAAAAAAGHTLTAVWRRYMTFPDAGPEAVRKQLVGPEFEEAPISKLAEMSR